MTVDELNLIYYNRLRSSPISVEELELLKNKRVHQVAEIRNTGSHEQFETARHYMAQVHAVERLLKEKQTDQRAKDAWRAVTIPNEMQDGEADDFDAFLESLNGDHRAESKPREMSENEANAYFDGSRSEKLTTDDDAHDVDIAVFNRIKNATDAKRGKTVLSTDKESGDKKGSVGSDSLGKKERRSIRTVRFFLWMPVALVLILGILVATNLFVLPMVDYGKAEKLFDKQQYPEAKAAYALVKGYRNADDMALECEYQQALVLAGNGQFSDAIAMFTGLGTYADSANQISKCYYDWAVQCYDLKQYDDATSYLDQAAGYSDAEEMQKRIKYERGTAYMNERDWDNALAMFQAVGDYKDSPVMISYIAALQAAERGDYTALEALRSTMDLEGLFAEIEAFNTTYSDFIGTFASANGNRIVEIYGCVINQKVTMRYSSSFMPQGDFLPDDYTVNEDGELVMTLDNGTYQLTITAERNTLEVVTVHGASSYDYTYTRKKE